MEPTGTEERGGRTPRPSPPSVSPGLSRRPLVAAQTEETGPKSLRKPPGQSQPQTQALGRPVPPGDAPRHGQKQEPPSQVT